MRVLNLKNFIFGNSVYAFFNINLMTFVLTAFMKEHGYLQGQISWLYSVESVVWFFGLYISGIIFDTKGARTAFLFGRFADLFSVILLFFPNTANLVIVMTCIGLAKGVNYGKYTSYIYNSLSLAGKLHLYPRLASAFYLTWDFAVSIGSFVSFFILKRYDYNILIIIAILLKVLAIVCVFIFVPNCKDADFSELKSPSVISIYKTIYECAKKNSTFTYMLIFYGLLYFFSYPLGATIGSIWLVEAGYNAKQIALYNGVFTACSSFGALLPIVWLKTGIKIKSCIFISLIQLCFVLFSAIINNIVMFIIAMCFIAITYALMEVSIECKIEDYSNKKVRGSAIAMAISLDTLLIAVNVMLVSFFGKMLSYNFGVAIIVLPIFLFLLFISKKVKTI